MAQAAVSHFTPNIGIKKVKDGARSDQQSRAGPKQEKGPFVCHENLERAASEGPKSY
ncbi:MAG: hypothetical protein JNK04_11835 [Myxococcales bacterium]|nr:hypothetical protein [Myxococcales bacterium]